jgi:hypothetical protein
MKNLRLIILPAMYLGLCFTASAQDRKPYEPKELPSLIPRKNTVKAKHRKYNRNVWRYVYTVFLHDGAKLEVNSNIFKDLEGGKHFLYHTDEKGLRKIVPSESTRITRVDSETMETVEGKPFGDVWLFKVIQGKMNAFTTFLDGKMNITHIQTGDGSLLEVPSPAAEAAIKTHEAAYSAYLSKDYLTAVKLYNLPAARKSG